ncbi:hypothetical protein [Arthrobacter alpinus]|uniref:hypothetical protein n=1 Tax=Arthrobacter alpinus TaxID=656366 RepID=UPI0012FF59B5|nr:hypothetical protein [Arthrobacter alpinus]
MNFQPSGRLTAAALPYGLLVLPSAVVGCGRRAGVAAGQQSNLLPSFGCTAVDELGELLTHQAASYSVVSAETCSDGSTIFPLPLASQAGISGLP